MKIRLLNTATSAPSGDASVRARGGDYSGVSVQKFVSRILCFQGCREDAREMQKKAGLPDNNV